MVEGAAQWGPGSVNSALLQRNPFWLLNLIHPYITSLLEHSFSLIRIEKKLCTQSMTPRFNRGAFYLRFSSWCFWFLICIMKIKPRGFKSMAIYFCLSYFCAEVLLPATPQPWLSILGYCVFSGTMISFQWDGPDKYDVIYYHYIAIFTLLLRFSALYLGRSDLRMRLGVTRSHLRFYFLFTICYWWIYKVKHISRLIILLSFPVLNGHTVNSFIFSLFICLPGCYTWNEKPQSLTGFTFSWGSSVTWEARDCKWFEKLNPDDTTFDTRPPFSH